MEKRFVSNALNELIPIGKIDEQLMTPRIRRMKETVQTLNDAGLRKTRLYVNLAQSLRTTVGEHQFIRRAKALVYHLEHVDQPIYEHEQLIGSVTGMWPVDAKRKPEYTQLRAEAVELLDNYFAHRDEKREDEAPRSRGGASFEESVAMNKLRFGSMMARDHYDANISFQDMQRLIEDMTAHYKGRHPFENWEIGSAIEKHFQYSYGEETMRLLRENGWNSANHTNLNYKSLVVKGLGGVLDEIRTHLEAADTEDKKVFYRACLITMEGVSDYIRRYGEAAKRSSEACSGERSAELAEMARILAKLSVGKPDTFTEAIELVWMFQLIGNLFGGSALSYGRFDQYMYPFYRRDIESGAIALERVRELIAALYLKTNEPRMRTVQSLCVGGVRVEDGEDACNDLSKICLEVSAALKMPYPNLSARVEPGKTPDWFYDEIVRTVKAGCGHPMILNDAVWVPNLASLGMPVEWARDYYNMGCTEIMIQGKDSNWAGGPSILFPAILNRQIEKAAQNGTQYADFNAFLAEFLEAIRENCAHSIAEGMKNITMQRQLNCDPFASSLIEGCLESGRDYFREGSLLGEPCAIHAQGVGTAADALSVIRKFVFEEKQLSLSGLWEVLRTDYAGQELLRLRFANTAPTFGNDDDYADEMAKAVFDTYSTAVRAGNEGRLNKTRVVNNVFSYNHHVAMGEGLGATANGRHAGEPISDCIGPTQGCDAEGSTALLNSILKLSPEDVTGAYALNFRINPALVSDETGTHALVLLLKAYLRGKGPQIQINYQNPEDLLDAQLHPEKHRDLVVRIAGYCEYFINLDRRLQAEIITRTLHGVA